MFLYDIGAVPFEEPYKKRTTQGLVLAEDGSKMSKSAGNSVDPMIMINEYGADVLRLYILFMSEYECSAPWSSANISGCKRFLDRVERLADLVDGFNGIHTEHIADLNTIIEKVSEDINTVKFNTAVSALMTFVNKIYQDKYLSKDEFRVFLQLLYPFAPHFAEEMNERLGFKEYICLSSWPKVMEDNSIKQINLPVQVNGKMKGTILVNENTTQEEVLKLIKQNDRFAQFVSGEIKKVIFIFCCSFRTCSIHIMRQKGH